MIPDLQTQIIHIHIALGVAGDRHHAHAGHHGTGRIGAMGTGGDQTHIAVALAAGLMPGTDHQQTRKLPLGAGIGLQRHPSKPRQGRQPALQIPRHLLIALELICGSKRMDGAEFTPTHRRQLRRSIELHGAAAERDHAVHQREVLADQTLDVAQQLRFAAVAMKHRLLQPGRRPQGHSGQR